MSDTAPLFLWRKCEVDEERLALRPAVTASRKHPALRDQRVKCGQSTPRRASGQRFLQLKGPHDGLVIIPARDVPLHVYQVRIPSAGPDYVATAEQAQVFLTQGFAHHLGVKIPQRAVPAAGAVLPPQFRVVQVNANR